MIVDSEEAFDGADENDALFLASEKMLSDFPLLPNEFTYVYDFGDNWKHVNKINAVVEGYHKNTAEFIEGAGNAPPEDVGGVGGYLTFLEALSDSNHPEHENVVQWISSQCKYQPFDAERTKRRLQAFIIGGCVRDFW